MIAKIQQVEELLIEISKQIKKEMELNQKRVITLKEIDKAISTLKSYNCDIPQEQITLRNKIFHEIQEYNDSNNVGKLKMILTSTLSEIFPTVKSSRESGFGNRTFSPNHDFIKLINSGILTTESVIFGRFQEKVYEGHLTLNGFFELKLYEKTKLFSSFTTAASAICGKPVAHGWKKWFCMEDNEEKALEYFRNKLNENKN